jgi:hypothetical protein
MDDGFMPDTVMPPRPVVTLYRAQHLILAGALGVGQRPVGGEQERGRSSATSTPMSPMDR